MCFLIYFQTHKKIFTLINFMSKVKIIKVTFNSPRGDAARSVRNERADERCAWE